MVHMDIRNTVKYIELFAASVGLQTALAKLPWRDVAYKNNRCGFNRYISITAESRPGEEIVIMVTSAPAHAIDKTIDNDFRDRITHMLALSVGEGNWFDTGVLEDIGALAGQVEAAVKRRDQFRKYDRKKKPESYHRVERRKATPEDASDYEEDDGPVENPFLVLPELLESARYAWASAR